MPAERVARQIRIEGRVQGVGFRPFVFRLAERLGIAGWVRNQGGVVELHAEGDPLVVETFLHALRNECPPSACISGIEVVGVAEIACTDFKILMSREIECEERVLPPDQAVCSDCLSEISDPQSPRYGYAFTHCTQCGPRYTLIRGFPLDRAQTAMQSFPPCAACLREYHDPSNRRFHAQNICCPICGPQLYFSAKEKDGLAAQDPLEASRAVIRRGGILAVKGMGGYHLLCDAVSDGAIRALRARKNRPHRPFAVMIHPKILERLPRPWTSQLEDSACPVVLVPKSLAPDLAEGVAPGLAEVGLLLPDSPLHHLLLQGFDGPLVMTSANLSGEPMLTENANAEMALKAMADGFLHHDRAIDRPADDAVFRFIGGSFRPLRLGRGNAPRRQSLRRPLAGCLLAVGGDLKNTVALAHNDQVVISPHLGDLSSASTLEVFRQVIQDLSDLLGFVPDRIACDAHPDARSALWAEDLGLPIIKIPHHFAHASALYEEFGQTEAMLVLTFDGLGYGPDDTLWGGEALWGRPGAWQRVVSLRPLKLLGGDRASREPWRLGAAVAFDAGCTWNDGPAGAKTAVELLEKGIQVPETSSMGRLFDAAAALLGICQEQSYEGQAAMMLEALSVGGAPAVPLPLLDEAQGPLRWDWRPLIPILLDSKRSPTERGSVFHASIAQAVVDLALRYRERQGLSVVGLTGGVFQNNLLTLEIQQRAADFGIQILIPEQVPLNDAGLSFGQVVEAEAIQREKMGNRAS